MTIEVRIGSQTYIAEDLVVHAIGFPRVVCVGDAVDIVIEGKKVTATVTGAAGEEGSCRIHAASWLEATRIGNALFEWSERCGADTHLTVTP